MPIVFRQFALTSEPKYIIPGTPYSIITIETKIIPYPVAFIVFLCESSYREFIMGKSALWHPRPYRRTANDFATVWSDPVYHTLPSNLFSLVKLSATKMKPKNVTLVTSIILSAFISFNSFFYIKKHIKMPIKIL